ncbi:hypothetical protein [Spirosoma utsteinense]|uniref:hypothetical protein n=1 Tax=Spirosoma utsteinense TaxID=2585773 RepID=UPI001648FD95|nr:hypothetical protein [Spirosoma utsteinense]MBC3785726.1 hypothetical protein [Spirosoma utsteinense]
MALSQSELLSRAYEIFDETIPSANTAERVGGLLIEIIRAATKPYAPTATYQAGEYVLFNDNLWRSLVAIAVSESPTAAPTKWRQQTGRDTLDTILSRGNASDRDMQVRTLTTTDFPAIRDNLEPAAIVVNLNGKREWVKATWSRMLEYLALASEQYALDTFRNALNITVAFIQNATGQKVFFEGLSLTLLAPYVQTGGVMLARTFRRIVTSPASRDPTLFLVTELLDDGTYDDRTVSPSVMWKALKPYAVADLSAVDVPGDSRVAEAVFCLPKAEPVLAEQTLTITAIADGAQINHQLGTAEILPDFFERLPNGTYKRVSDIGFSAVTTTQLTLAIPTDRSPWTGKIFARKA